MKSTDSVLLESEDQSHFIAHFPSIQSAITFHGNGGMRVQFDIPENQIGEAAKLLMWREQLLDIIIVPIGKGDQPDVVVDDKLESMEL